MASWDCNMSSTPDRATRGELSSRRVTAPWRSAAVALWLAGCGLTRPSDPPPLDCASLDRAAERFPDECGESSEEPDAGVGEDAPSGEE